MNKELIEGVCKCRFMSINVTSVEVYLMFFNQLGRRMKI